MFKKMYSKPEVLAPAGSMEALKAAIYAGADAVYVGGSQFGARAFADNFSKDELLGAIDFVHTYGKKIYMTVNTLLKEKEIREVLYEYLLPFYAQGLDAVIVQDVGVFALVREVFPDLPVHISTQMGVLTEYGAKTMKFEGATRVVPGRELSIEEVRDITAVLDFETECFVHGALCYCYSGQCFLSSRIGGRSGNRGRCAQPCRLQYQLVDECGSFGQNRYGKDGRKEACYLSPKDLCSLEYLPELIQAGVDSLKIEGRMKKPEYVSAVTRVYRKYVDIALECLENETDYIVDEADQLLLRQLFNRGGFTDGYWYQHNGQEMMSIERPNHNGVYIGEVERIEKGSIFFTTKEQLHRRDVIELRLGDDVIELTSPLDASAGSCVRLNANQIKRIQCGMKLYRMKSPHMIEQVLGSGDAKIKLNATLRLQVGQPMELTYSLLENEYVLGMATGPILEAASKQAATREQVEKTVSQFGGTYYEIGAIETLLDASVFVPGKALKQLRRDALEQLEQNIMGLSRKSLDSVQPIHTFFENCSKNLQSIVQDMTLDFASNHKHTNDEQCAIGKLMVQCHTVAQLQCALQSESVGRVIISYGCALALKKDKLAQLLVEFEKAHHETKCDVNAKKQIYLALPSMFRKKDAQLVEPLLAIPEISGALVGSLDAFSYMLTMENEIFSKRNEFSVLFSDTLYCYNTIAFGYWMRKLSASRYCYGGVIAPKELSLRELKELNLPGLCLPLYGHTVVMTSAQCVKRTAGCCGNARSIDEDGRIGQSDSCQSLTKIKDRKGKVYQLEHICMSCHTVLREQEPVSLSGCYCDVMDLLVGQYYLEFVDEDDQTMSTILENFEKEYISLDPSFLIVEGNTAYYYAPID